MKGRGVSAEVVGGHVRVSLSPPFLTGGDHAAPINCSTQITPLCVTCPDPDGKYKLVTGWWKRWSTERLKILISAVGRRLFRLLMQTNTDLNFLKSMIFLPILFYIDSAIAFFLVAKVKTKERQLNCFSENNRHILATSH